MSDEAAPLTSTAPAVNIKVEEEEDMEGDGSVGGGAKSVIIEDNEDDIDPKEVWRVAFPFNEYQLFLRPATISKYCYVFFLFSF